MTKFIDALSVRNFRGVGDEAQDIAPLSTLNLFIGPNNAGKSTVLDALVRYFPIGTSEKSKVAINPLDMHLASGRTPPTFAMGFSPDKIAKQLIDQKKITRSEVMDALNNIVRALSDGEWVWIEDRPPYKLSPRLRHNLDVNDLRALLHRDLWYAVWTGLTNHQQGDLIRHWIPETVDAILKTPSLQIPPVVFIPALRQIGPKDQGFGDFSGVGLIDKLAEIQNPGVLSRADLQLFEKINSFVKTITVDESARIEIPHDREHVMVHMDGRVLPLESLGTGIQQVVMLAAFCTITNESIVCLEEPELHLHPLLQKRLIRYITLNTTNQYFIATHSPALIDTPGAAIFRVCQEEGKSRVSSAKLNKEKFQICVDLGHRASDLLQANAIVWVEGPSDRIYLNHWIRAQAPDLLEGTHYSVMFYGGRLLSHLSAEDEEVTDFINLRQLNRNIAILIDSDRPKKGVALNTTKKRIIREFNEHGGVAWVTQGREIENYVPHSILQYAVKETHSSYEKPAAGGAYDHALHFMRAPKKGERRPQLNTSVDKVKVAREVCRQEAVLDHLDLRRRVAELVTLIRSANEAS